MPAERVRDRANVGAAADVKLELGRAAARSDGTLSACTVDHAQGHLDGDSPPVEAVRTLPADLHGRRRRARAARPRRTSASSAGVERPSGSGVSSSVVALGVAGRGSPSELDLGHVALVETDEVASEPRRGPEQDEQQTARERVERARVAGLAPPWRFRS